jgi:thiamine biosynthesis protein ThiS
MRFVLNGQPREFPDLGSLQELIADLGLKGDRVAVEHNGNIVPRADWVSTALADGDRLEIVHFVGGGCAGRGTGNDAHEAQEAHEGVASPRRDARENAYFAD